MTPPTLPNMQNKLKQKAITILNNCFNVNKDAYENYLGQYWAELFSEELEIVKRQKEIKGLEIPTNSHLILTLGMSLEPLVLAVHLVAPQTVYVLFTDNNHLAKFKEALEKTKSIEDYTSKVKPILLWEDNAAFVFRLLRGKADGQVRDDDKPHVKELLELMDTEAGRQSLVFDITGAKKTISGGCLLFAAYYEVPVYYMDFGKKKGDYYEDLGRPYPGTCFYTRQANPIASFSLKDFQNIQKAFNDRRFHEVEVLLKPVIEKMQRDPDKFFEDTEIKLYQDCLARTEMYQDWQGGWWGDVFDRINLVHDEAKTLIMCLKNYSRKAKKVTYSFQTDLYDDLPGFAAYVILELATLVRGLGSLPTRHLFLRAYGLEEFLLSFLYYRLFQESKLAYDAGDDLAVLDKEGHLKMAICEGYFFLEKFLLGKAKPEDQPRRVMRPSSIPEEIWESADHRLRFNDITHTFSDQVKKEIKFFNDCGVEYSFLIFNR